MLRRVVGVAAAVVTAVLVVGVVLAAVGDPESGAADSEQRAADRESSEASPGRDSAEADGDVSSERVAGGHDGAASDPEHQTSGGDATEVADGGVLVMWARGGLPPEIADRAMELPAVEAAAFVRSDTLGLVGSRDADGRAMDELADGFRIPVGVSAVDPATYAATTGWEELVPLVAALGPGEVLLTERAAGLRGIGVGGELDLGDRAGLRVAGVLPEGVLRRSEILAHVADADELGIPAGGSLVVRHSAAPGEETEALADGLEALAPGDAPARVVGSGRDDGRHDAPLVLSLLELKERFGEFAYRPRPGMREIDVDPAFLAEHIVAVSVPVLGTVRCHAGIVDDLRAALVEIVEAGLAEHLNPARYGGCFHPRRISADRDRLSSHAWGVAIDINVDLSMPGLGPVPPDEMIEIFGRHGFRWGGDFIQPDNHHYEWVGPAAAHRPGR